MRTRTSLLASLVLGVVLVGLGLASWSALSSIRAAQQETLRTRESAIAYNDVRAAVAGEAISEAGYRRAPSPAARERLDEAIGAVDQALADAHTATARRDGPVLANLKLLNQRYVDQVRSTLDDGAVGADDRVAGPALDSIQKLLESAIASHRVDLIQATKTEIELASRLRWLLPAAFGLTLAIVGWTMRRLFREHRRVGRDAAVARELAQQRAALLVEEQRQVGILGDLERERENFLAMVSHDLVNPITAVEWYAELIAENPDLPPGVDRQVDVIRDRARQVQRLVADLGRGAAPSILQDKVDLDLAHLVADAVETAAARAATAGVRLTSDVRSAAVVGDVDRLRQVIDNLLGNAIKYTPAHEEVHVVVCADGDDAVLRISDTGIGIPEDQLNHIFDAYYRASTATAAGVGGTGLGLAITKSIVEGHGGTVRATAVRPHGTTVEVRIPRAKSELPV